MIEFRFLEEEDAELYWHLRLEALSQDPEAFGSSAEEHALTKPDAIAKRVRNVEQGNFVVGAFSDGKLRGSAGFLRYEGLKERHKGFIWGVYVGPELRGQGVGRRMMQRLLERARSYEGLEYVKLSVSGGEAARQLYISLGFVPFGTEIDSLKIGDRFVDEEHMALRLR